MDTIKIDIKPEENTIRVRLYISFEFSRWIILNRTVSLPIYKFWFWFQIYNNGQGIPVEMHKEQNMYVPTMIFGHLLTSSNFEDDDKKVTGGRNGFGAKLCNVFSTKFTLETANKESKKEFKQSWSKNMSKADDPKVKPLDQKEFTRITYKPDLEKFNMQAIDKVKIPKY